MSKLIYLDNAATTKVAEPVFEAMKPFFMECYCNPSSVYSFADEGKKAVEKARGQIGRCNRSQAGRNLFYRRRQ